MGGEGKETGGWEAEPAVTQLARQAPDTHTRPFFSHLKICVRLARFLFVYFLWGRTGRLMNKDINFQKNPKPNSILLPTLRAYIILQCFSSRPSLTPSPFSSLPLAHIENTWKPRNASFQSPLCS